MYASVLRLKERKNFGFSWLCSFFNKMAHNAGVNVKMIDQGSGELNLIIGIDESDFEKAIVALYSEFFDDESGTV